MAERNVDASTPLTQDCRYAKRQVTADGMLCMLSLRRQRAKRNTTCKHAALAADRHVGIGAFRACRLLRDS